MKLNRRKACRTVSFRIGCLRKKKKDGAGNPRRPFSCRGCPPRRHGRGGGMGGQGRGSTMMLIDWMIQLLQNRIAGMTMWPTPMALKKKPQKAQKDT
jgi:hypothetical protein